ncbi:hypothetical protein FPRO05_05602 [Fusarium proliferatum]|uniref:Protein kinase domain-containing protein n=1 Tax=Gibberella intermedia TaxID=948311 RepID=A0A365MMB1_GIBIN|nr:hypothetical protein FPRO05_05602 [Fusarium proliferatum]
MSQSGATGARPLPNIEVPSVSSRQMAQPSFLDNEWKSNDTFLSPPAQQPSRSESDRSVLSFASMQSVHDRGKEIRVGLEERLVHPGSLAMATAMVNKHREFLRDQTVTAETLSSAIRKHSPRSQLHPKDRFLPYDVLEALINPTSTTELLNSMKFRKGEVKALVNGIFGGDLLSEQESPHGIVALKSLEFRKGQVKTLLTGIFGNDLPSKQESAQRGNQCRRDAISRRILALLILTDKVTEVKRFIQQGINDSVLPLMLPTADEIKVRGLNAEHRVISLASPSMNHKLHECFSRFTDNQLDHFCTNQKLLSAPFFSFPENNSKVCYYDLDFLDSDCVLPIMAVGEPIRGGNGSVQRIEIHHAHHNYRGGAEVPWRNSFAIKKLHIHNEERFKKEVEALLKLSPKGNGKTLDHLVHLELAYKYRDEYFLVFPWAGGNLKEYWKAHDRNPNSYQDVIWFFKQCLGLATGLYRLHNLQNMAIGAAANNTDNTAEDILYGRHGDLKPENILWFDDYHGDLHHLAICDFGSTEFNSIYSKSLVDPEKVRGYSKTYQPPDSHVEDNVNQRFDIWSLGCVFLEFISWLLLGHDETVEGFPAERTRGNPVSAAVVYKEDRFFYIDHSDEKSGYKLAKVNPGVLNWIRKLHHLPSCPESIHKFLDLIQRHMLQPKPSNRNDCEGIRDKLREINESCVDKTYATKGYADTSRGANGGEPQLLETTGDKYNSGPPQNMYYDLNSRSQGVQKPSTKLAVDWPTLQAENQHAELYPALSDEMRDQAPLPREFAFGIRDSTGGPNERRSKHIAQYREPRALKLQVQFTNGTSGDSSELQEQTTNDTTPYATQPEGPEIDFQDDCAGYPQDVIMDISPKASTIGHHSTNIEPCHSMVAEHCQYAGSEAIPSISCGTREPRSTNNVSEIGILPPQSRTKTSSRADRVDATVQAFPAIRGQLNKLSGKLRSLGKRGRGWKALLTREEVRDLRNLIETIEPILGSQRDPDNEDAGHRETSRLMSHSIRPVVLSCLSELQTLESMIRPKQVDALLESKGKALLESLSWRLKGNDVTQSIANLQRCKTSLNLVISSHNSNIERLSLSINDKTTQSDQRLDTFNTNLERSQLDKQQTAIMNWLSPLKPGHNHSQLKSARQPGTAEWFHKSKRFEDWFRGRNTMLWLSGPPGSGKSVMMSQAIEAVASRISQCEEPAAYAFVYCDFRDPNTQDIINIFGALLSQLCAQIGIFPVELVEAYESSTKENHGYGPTIEIISQTIQILSMNRRVYLLIDALDEAKDYKQLVNQLTTLNASSTSMNGLVASRNEVTIQRILAEFPRLCLEDYMSKIDKDVELYIETWLGTDQDLEWLSPDVQSLVLASLMSKSQGSFQWVTCQLGSLRRCRTTRDIKKCLSKLPEGLNETYGRALARTAPSEVNIVKKIMSWLSLATIPLTLHELWEALAIEKGRKEIDDEARLRSQQDILILCNGLITVSSEGYVMLAHLSVRDYLLSGEISKHPETAQFALQPSKCHMELAQDCLTYLSFSELSPGPSSTQGDYLYRLKRLPLIQYASRYWFHHFRNAESDGPLNKLCLGLFYPEGRGNFMSWVQVFNATSPFKWNIFPRHATSLYYAASLGLGSVVDILLQKSTIDEVNAPGSRFGGTAVHAAAIRGHSAIIKRLVEAGADPGKADFNKVTPLHSSAGQGSLETIEILLDCGAPTEAKDGMEGKTSADWARLGGFTDAANLIEQHSHNPRLMNKIELDSDTQSGIHTDTYGERGTIEVWQPRVGYFPNYYERRSGLDSSYITSITAGDKTLVLNSSILLLQDNNREGLGFVW